MEPTPALARSWLQWSRDKLSMARRHYQYAKEGGYAEAGECLHAAAELSLKAIVIASGVEHRHIHHLGSLWQHAESADKPIKATMTDEEDVKPRILKKLTMYGTGDRYDRPSPEDARADCDRALPAVAALVAYAGRRVPMILKARERREQMFDQSARGPHAAPTKNRGPAR